MTASKRIAEASPPTPDLPDGATPGKIPRSLGASAATLVVLLAVAFGLASDDQWTPFIIRLSLISASSITLGAGALYMFSNAHRVSGVWWIVPIALALAFQCVGNLAWGVPEMFRVIFNGTFCASCAMAIFAGYRASRMQVGRPGQGVVTLLALWLVLPLLWGLFYLTTGDNPRYGIAEVITSTGALLFGPWATLAAMLGSWPNAGEFLNLPTAVILTLVVIVSIELVLTSQKRTVAAFGLIVYTAALPPFFLVGLFQLINCAS